jgi:hypothetical protein
MSATSRAELAQRVAELRSRGLLHVEVANRLGISRSYAAELATDPDGIKARSRKDAYRGSCEVCGAPTDGSNGRASAPTRCLLHPLQEWPAGRVIEAMRAWTAWAGHQPTADEWRYQPSDDEPDRPVTNTVIDRFGSWADGVEATGLVRPRTGYRVNADGAYEHNWSRPRQTHCHRGHEIRTTSKGYRYCPDCRALSRGRNVPRSPDGLCLCGCGEPVNFRYARGHNKRLWWSEQRAMAAA